MSEETEQAGRLSRIETTLEQVLKNQVELGTKLEAVNLNIAERTVFCAAQAPVYKMQIEKTIDHETRIRVIEDAVTDLKYPVKVVTWIGAALGLSVIGLILSIITGQVLLVFP